MTIEINGNVWLIPGTDAEDFQSHDCCSTYMANCWTYILAQYNGPRYVCC